jgi:CRP-like cAMP-binding protein
VLGEVSLLDGAPRSASAEAIEDCAALALSRGAFIELVHANPRILDAVMRSLGGLIRRLTDQNADYVFLDLPGRVAKTLVRLAGETTAPMVTIELNQSQLAEMAGDTAAKDDLNKQYEAALETQKRLSAEATKRKEAEEAAKPSPPAS